MRLHLADHALIDTDGLWAPLEPAATALGLAVEPLGDGRIGLCPAPDVCVPVPASARRDELVDLQALAGPLGLAVAGDHHDTVVLPGSAGTTAGHADVGTRVELALPDVRTGEPVALAVKDRRSVVFAWASW